MNYYEEIKTKLIDNEVYIRVKDYSKERHNLITHYEVGKLLAEAGKKYGENIIGKYSQKLIYDVGKKYNSRTLRRMRQLYLFFEEQKWSPSGTKLSLSHIRELFILNSTVEIQYYVSLCIQNNLTRDELKEKIKNKEYERLDANAKNKLISKNNIDIKEHVPNPILIKNKHNIDVVNEKILHGLIMEDISSFMKELGIGYSFIDSEYKIKIGNSYNYIDLLLFNIEYNCYVIVELKVTELKKEHIGQVEIYMNYINNNLKKTEMTNTIGIIICKKENKFVMEYCTDKRIINREYELI